MNINEQFASARIAALTGLEWHVILLIGGAARVLRARLRRLPLRAADEESRLSTILQRLVKTGEIQAIYRKRTAWS
jgi:hypothetical protein